MKTKPFKSYSGDWYKIPIEQFDIDTAGYKKAVSELNEELMLHYEEGCTGWTSVGSAREAFL